MLGVRTSKSSTISSVRARGAAAVDPARPRANGGWVWWPSIAFSHSGAVEQQAVALAVLGDVADARARALARGRSGVMSSPPSVMRPRRPAAGAR